MEATFIKVENVSQKRILTINQNHYRYRINLNEIILPKLELFHFNRLLDVFNAFEIIS